MRTVGLTEQSLRTGPRAAGRRPADHPEGIDPTRLGQTALDVQTTLGRVPPSRDAILTIQRTAGNRAAGRLLRDRSLVTDRTGNGESARSSNLTVQRLTHINQGAQNYPGIYKKRSIRSDKAVPNATIFTSQSERDTDGGRTWFGAADQPEANLVHRSSTNITVSDACDLAIERTSNEPKVFFATSQRLKQSNDVLKAKASPVRLEATSHYLRMTDGHGQTKKLYQVVPKVGKTKGTDVKTPQRCNEMADFVLKAKGADFKAQNQAWELLARALDKLGVAVPNRPADSPVGAHEADSWLDELADTKNASYRNREAQAQLLTLLSNMSGEFQRQHANHANEMEAVLADLNLNGYMMPKVGDVVVTYAEATTAQEATRGADTFLYHFGSVVAASGSDYIAMENYARRDPTVGNKTASGGDPLFFFKMYGPDNSGETWHDKALATNAFLGATLSFVVE